MPSKKPTKPTPKKNARKPAAPKLNTDWHERFLRILSSTCNVTLAAEGAGIDRTSAYDHYKRLPEFAAKWDAAKEAAVEVLEGHAWERAKKKSDLLLIFLLKAHKPEMYREQLDVNVRKLSDADLIAAATAALRGSATARTED